MGRKRFSTRPQPASDPRGEPASAAPVSLPVIAGRGLGDDEVELGSIVGFFGVRGELRVHLHHRGSHLMKAATEVVLVGPSGERRSGRIRCRPGAGKRVLARLDGVSSREAAEPWKGWRFAVARAALPTPADDEFYVVDVEGARALVAGHEAPVGTVVTVHVTPGGDLFEIERADGDPVFVPAGLGLVLEVDREAGAVRFDGRLLDHLTDVEEEA